MYRVRPSIFSDNLFGKNIKLILSKKILDKILSHVKEMYPDEVCGILVGEIFDENYRVKDVYRLENIFKIKYRFWFDVREWMEKIIEARKRGFKYIGIYHSHSNNSIMPSLNDSERMLECPGEIWLIIAYSFKEVRYAAWTILGYELGLTKINIVI